MATRPTPDRLREALFNVLTPRIEGAVFADVYAGSGSVGIEALSRGARRVIFVESNRGAADVIRENLASLGIEARAELLRARAGAALSRMEADIVFLDPPYALAKEYSEALTALAAGSFPLVIAQHASREALVDNCGRLRRIRILRQGDNALSFYE